MMFSGSYYIEPEVRKSNIERVASYSKYNSDARKTIRKANWDSPQVLYEGNVSAR